MTAGSPPDDSVRTASDRMAGVVLAAGVSRRMGPAINKLLLEIDGEPMVRRVTRRALDGGLDPVVVVTGHESDAVRAALREVPCAFVESPDPSGPTSASLHAGLRALDASVAAAVVMLGDMVHVTAAMIRAVVAALSRTEERPLAASWYGGRAYAPPLAFRRSLWPELLAWEGEGCGKAVLMAHLEEAAVVEWPAEALADVDTPEDYRNLVG